MDWPVVCVLMVTYDRPVEIRTAICALIDNIVYSGNVMWHIADDGSPDGYVQSVREELLDICDFSYTTTDRKGWGENVNMALVHLDVDYIFLCEDDYIAQRSIELDEGVLLLQHCGFGVVRYDGIGGHTLDLELRECETPTGQLNYLRILNSSPHLNVYSNRPHLRHRRFTDHYGLYPVGVPLGQTESEYAHRVKDDPSGPGIVVLPDGIRKAFDHIGKSRQGTELDVHK